MLRKIFVFLALLPLACTKNPQKVRQQAAECAGEGDWACAEKNYRWLLQGKPDDVIFRANLAFALTRQDKHQEAVPYYEKIIAEGEGTYDVFAHFAESLQGVGRSDEAIVWYYRTLAITPKLVDVRGNLAKLLVKQDRAYEALSLLASFDEYLESQGDTPYFKGDRIAIASGLKAPQDAKTQALVVPKLDGHYVTVVMDKGGEPLPFIVDTGASSTTLSPKVLEALGLSVPANAKTLKLQMADRSHTKGQEFVIPSLQVGSEMLKNVSVIVCDSCASLLGQTTLERFDLATRKDKGVEFLSMKRRI